MIVAKALFATFFSLILLLFPVSGDCRELVFSIHPFTNPVDINKRFEPLVNYLAKSIDIPIRIRIAPNYMSHIITLGSGNADLGFAGPSPYVRMKDKFGAVNLLARFKFVDDQNDKIVIISRKDSGLQGIKDLKGKDFAFGDHQSYGSHFMPRWVLDQNGVTLNDLVAYDFVKSHDNVLLSVLHGDFAAGGVRLDVYEKYSDRALRVLAGPFPIPPHVLVCSNSLEAELQEKLQKSLLSLTDRKVLDMINSNLDSFQPVEDSEFDPARRVMGFLESR